ncbi:MAG: hypothetical protein DELT_01256 [Desulfovibrio sp.]
MPTNMIGDLLVACHEARRVIEMMPKLPDGLSPRHVYVIDTIYQLRRGKQTVKVSDVSKKLRVTKPSITKLINELEKLSVVEKATDSKDKRIKLLTLTPLGEQYYDIYVYKYNLWLSEQLSDIHPHEVTTTIHTIKRIYHAVSMGIHQGTFDDSL